MACLTVPASDVLCWGDLRFSFSFSSSLELTSAFSGLFAWARDLESDAAESCVSLPVLNSS